MVWAASADWERLSAHPRAGRLLVTDDVLAFVAYHGVEPGWEAPLVDIADVSLTDWPPSMGRGRARKRVRIETADGHAELFGIATVSHAVDVIRAAVRAAGGSA